MFPWSFIDFFSALKVPNFFSATELIDVDGSKKSWSLPLDQSEFIYINSCGLRYEAEEIRKCIRSGKKENQFIRHNESLIIARIEDEIRRQIGVKYPEDEEELILEHTA